MSKQNGVKTWLESVIISFHLIFKEFRVSLSKTACPPFQMVNWARCLVCHIFCCFRGSFIFFLQFSFPYVLKEYNIFDLCTLVLIEALRLRLIFLLSKRSPFCSKYEFSVLNCYTFLSHCMLNCYIFCLSLCYHGQS